jgi:WD40 repeat protein/serine/threonine protein kinase
MSEREIFTAALDIASAAERAAYLDEACAGDAALRQRMELLVQAHKPGDGFLERPAGETWATIDEPSFPEQPGSVIGPYKLLQQIGEGGMGVVYMAEQTAPVRRRVALKIIKPGMDSRQVIARFEAERQALALMDHHNIARVLDAGTTESGRPYFVMELVHGVPITEFCDENRLTTRERLELFVPVCQALQHAHQKGIIHRDVKPSNVLVTMYDDKPVPKVIDFGVAKATEQRLTDKTMFTQFGAFVGTFEYMSPEQAEMNALGVDTRSDVYSLGVLLYELLTGTTPLGRSRLQEASLNEIVRWIKDEEPPRPSARLSSSDTLPSIAAARKTEPARLSALVRGEIDWIVMKCLEKDRSRRYDTASALARDIQRHLADETVEACPPSAGYRLRKFARKNKKALALAGAFALLLLAGTAISSWQAMRATYAEMEATTQRSAAATAEQQAKDDRDKALAAGQRAKDAADVARTEAAFAESAGDELRGTLYAAHMNLIQAAWDADNLGRVLELLEQHRPSPGEPDNRGFEWRYWQRQCHPELSTVKLDQPLRGHAVLSRDGKLIACLQPGSPSIVVRLWDATNGKVLRTWTLDPVRGTFPNWLGFSPDSKQLMIAWRFITSGLQPPPDQNEAIKILDVATGKEIRAIRAELYLRSVYSGPTFSPDGKRVACHTIERGADGKRTGFALKVWDAATGKEELSIPLSRPPGSHVAFSPDGKFVAAAPAATAEERTPDVLVEIRDAVTGKVLSAIKNPGIPPHYLAFSPDGKHLATLSRRTNPAAPWQGSEVAGLWDVTTGKQVLTFQETPIDAASATFSPDGKLVTWCAGLMGTLSPTIRVWDTATGRVRITLKGHTSGVECVAFSTDSTRLHSASVDGTLKTFALPAADTEPDSALILSARQYGMVAFSPDGTRYTMPATVQGANSIVRVLDATTRKELFSFREHSGPVHNVTFSPDGKRIASVAVLPAPDKALEVMIWDAATGKVAGVVNLKEFGVRLSPGNWLANVPSVTFSRDGGHIALNHGVVVDENGKQRSLVRIWDVGRAREVFASDDESGIPSSVHFSPDGKHLVAFRGSPFKIKVLDAASHREVATLEGEEGEIIELHPASPAGLAPLANPVFSRDGTRLAYLYGARRGPDGKARIYYTVSVWDIATGRRLMSFPGGTVRGIALSPDGRRLAAALDNGGQARMVRVWDADTAKILLTLHGHSQQITGVAFSPDGRRIASMDSPPNAPRARTDVRVWDAATGHELMTLTGASELRASRLFFSPDGSRLMAAGLPVAAAKDPLAVWDARPLPEAAPPVEKIKETIPAWGDVIDPVGDCTVRTTDGKLTLAVPGTEHDLIKDNRDAPRVLTAVEGDFTVQVKVTGDFDPGKDGFNGAGLLLWIDHENYLRLERNAWFDALAGKLAWYPPLFEYWQNGKRLDTNPGGTTEPFFKGRSTYFRLQRRQGTILASVSHNGKEWIALEPLRIALPKRMRVGVAAVNTSKQPFVVEFSELKLTTN